MTEQRRRVAALALLTFGLLSVLGGGAVYAQAWYGSWTYSHSDQAEQAARQLAALETHPRWVEASADADEATFVSERETWGSSEAPAGASEHELLPSPAQVTPSSAAGVPLSAGQSNEPSQLSVPGPRLPALPPPPDEPSSLPLSRSDAPALPATATAAAAATPLPVAASEVELRGSEFRFFDPPEPGAHARIAVQLRNRSELPTEPLGLVIPVGWFAGYQVIGAIPTVLDDRPAGEQARRFEFPPLEPGAEVTLELHLTATDEDLTAPELKLELASGAVLGSLRPEVVAPRPRPGPARAISIPRLGLRAPVVPTVWEPPQFVVGQIRGSANLSLGNTVLIGHLRGPNGNVFQQIERLQPGDEVVAVSRGLEYRFMVSDRTTLPNNDTGPIQETPTPRLTMMTCTGTWNPFTDDYSHRLWIVAEPPELARQTIATNAARAAEAAAAAEAQARQQAEERERARQQEAAAEQERLAAAVVESAQPAETVAAEPEPASPEPGADTAVEEAPPSTASISPPLAREPAPAPAAGLRITSPTDNARVSSRLVVKGSRALPIDPELQAWLFVRAELEGSKWYPYPRALEAGRNGRWEAELELGGPAGLRHELRVGTLDPASHQALLEQLAEHPNGALDELPAGFAEESSLVVTKR